MGVGLWPTGQSIPEAAGSHSPQAEIAASAQPGSPVPNPRLTSPGQTLQSSLERERVRSHPCVHRFLITFLQREGRKGTKRKSGEVSWPSHPPGFPLPPDSSCRPKITKPFRSKPQEKKERKAKGREAAAVNFKKRANLCSAGQLHLHNEMCRGCLAHVFFRRFNFNFI